MFSPVSRTAFAQTATDLTAYNDPPSRLRGVIEKYDDDVGFLNRFYTAQTSPKRIARFKQLYTDEAALVTGINFDVLNHDEQVDYILFKNYLDHELKEQSRFEAQLTEMADLIPFSRTINDLEDTRRTLKDIDQAKSAATLNDLAKQIVATQAAFTGPNAVKPKRTVANRAVRTVDGLRRTLRNW